MESDLSVINIPWWNGEPVPDHTTVSRHLQTISHGWLTRMLARTAKLCMAEAGGATGLLGADSSGVETTRYGTVVRPLKRERDFVETAQEYLKYHIVTILGLQIILESEITPGNVSDMTMLPPMLGEMGRYGLSPGLPVFNADRGYDSNHNCQLLFEMGIVPNIKQRGGAVNRGKPYRSRAAKTFDGEEYHQRGMIESVFGGEESKCHQLHCRFILPDNRRRFGKIRAIAWNIKMLNRLRYARIRGIEIRPTARCHACDRTDPDASPVKPRRGTCENEIRWNYATTPDDALRFVTAWGAFPEATMENAIAALEEAIARHGKPASII